MHPRQSEVKSLERDNVNNVSLTARHWGKHRRRKYQPKDQFKDWRGAGM